MVFPIIGLALAAISTAGGVAGSVIQAGAAQEAERARRGAQELEAQRSRIQAVREARIRRAETAAAAEAQGATGTSAALGAQASIGTQLQANLGFIESQSMAQRTISSAQRRAAVGGLVGDIGGAVGQVGTAFAGFQQRQAQAAAIREQNAATRVPPVGFTIGTPPASRFPQGL